MSIHLKKQKAHQAARKQRDKLPKGKSSGWSKLEVGIASKKLGPLTYYKTYRYTRGRRNK